MLEHILKPYFKRLKIDEIELSLKFVEEIVTKSELQLLFNKSQGLR